MALHKYGNSSKAPSSQPRTTEFDILKASHKFLRDDDDKNLSWDDQVAQKYYSNLYREFAVCDLKHYKSGNFALRWRTENEVLSGAGETTCGNTRCKHHAADGAMPPLSTLELPFAYEEQGETKSALVKIVLCERCVKKLLWKRQKEKEQAVISPESEERLGDPVEDQTSQKRSRAEDKQIRREKGGAEENRHRRRNSRSRSPRPRHKSDDPRSRRRSPKS